METEMKMDARAKVLNKHSHIRIVKDSCSAR